MSLSLINIVNIPLFVVLLPKARQYNKGFNARIQRNQLCHMFVVCASSELGHHFRPRQQSWRCTVSNLSSSLSTIDKLSLLLYLLTYLLTNLPTYLFVYLFNDTLNTFSRQKTQYRTDGDRSKTICASGGRLRH